VLWWRNFENRPVFDEVVCRLRWLTFLAQPVAYTEHLSSTASSYNQGRLSPNNQGIHPFHTSPFSSPPFARPSPFPSLSFPSTPNPPLSPISSLLRRSDPFNQLGSLGERCELPEWGLGPSPSRQLVCIVRGRNSFDSNYYMTEKSKLAFFTRFTMITLLLCCHLWLDLCICLISLRRHLIYIQSKNSKMLTSGRQYEVCKHIPTVTPLQTGGESASWSFGDGGGPV